MAGYVDGGLAGRAIVTNRRLLRLTRSLPPLCPVWDDGSGTDAEAARKYNSPAVGCEISALSPELRAAVEVLLHVPGWFGPAWMDTTVVFGGLKKLDLFPTVALAVAPRTTAGAVCLLDLKEGMVTAKLQDADVRDLLYEAPAGWHWGSMAEVAAIMAATAHRQQIDGMRRQTGMRWDGMRMGWPHPRPATTTLPGHLRLRRLAGGRLLFRLPLRI